MWNCLNFLNRIDAIPQDKREPVRIFWNDDWYIVIDCNPELIQLKREKDDNIIRIGRLNKEAYKELINILAGKGILAADI